MNIPGLTFQGKSIEDHETFNLLPPQLQELLSKRNGFIGLQGGIHIRGCTNNPIWHSLGEYWKGRNSFHTIYDFVLEDDIPFGQDCFGDQLLLREDKIYHLNSETGEFNLLSESLRQFLEQLEKNPISFLGLEAFEEWLKSGFCLSPGELINIYPPVVIHFEGERTAKAVSAESRLNFLQKFNKEIREISDGITVKIDPGEA